MARAEVCFHQMSSLSLRLEQLCAPRAGGKKLLRRADVCTLAEEFGVPIDDHGAALELALREMGCSPGAASADEPCVDSFEFEAWWKRQWLQGILYTHARVQWSFLPAPQGSVSQRAEQLGVRRGEVLRVVNAAHHEWWLCARCAAVDGILQQSSESGESGEAGEEAEQQGWVPAALLQGLNLGLAQN